MIAFHITGPSGLDALQPVVVPDLHPGPRDILVSARAWSLNYRDLAMPRGGYIRNDKVQHCPPLVPISDVAGTVIEVGDAVTRFQVGDRVMANFFLDWIDGELTSQQIGSALGGAIDGVLSEQVCLPERAWVPVPKHFSYSEAATLPCAAVTAWNALTTAGTRSGQTVLLLGTGGFFLKPCAGQDRFLNPAVVQFQLASHSLPSDLLHPFLTMAAGYLRIGCSTFLGFGGGTLEVGVNSKG